MNKFSHVSRRPYARFNYRESLASGGPTLIEALVVVGIILVVGAIVSTAAGSAEVVTVTVTDKDRITESDADGGVTSKYLVYTDKETFENTDSVIRWKFNSSDVQGQLIRGNTYQIRVVGRRSRVFSSYRNIVEIVRRVEPTPERNE